MKHCGTKKKKMYMGGMEVKRKPYAHGGKAGAARRDISKRKRYMKKQPQCMSMPLK